MQYGALVMRCGSQGSFDETQGSFDEMLCSFNEIRGFFDTRKCVVRITHAVAVERSESSEARTFDRILGSFEEIFQIIKGSFEEMCGRMLGSFERLLIECWALLRDI